MFGEVIEQPGVRGEHVVMQLGDFVFLGQPVRAIVVFLVEVYSFPAAVTRAQHRVPLIAEVKARCQVPGFLLGGVPAIFQPGVDVLELGHGAQVLPVGNLRVTFRVAIN